MRDSALPAAHGAWLVLLTGLLMGVVLGGQPSHGTLALAITVVTTFSAAERLLTVWAAQQPRPNAMRAGIVSACLAGVSGIWTLVLVGPMRLLWLVPFALLAAWAEKRLAGKARTRRSFEMVGMISLVLVLPAASIASGCPIAWPLAALSLAFLIHVAHAVLRTHAHMQPARRDRARIAGIVGGVIVLVLGFTQHLPLVVSLAILIGLAEPWLPNWRPMPAKKIGQRETILILGLPLALLFASQL
jgi:YwiC-like protein